MPNDMRRILVGVAVAAALCLAALAGAIFVSRGTGADAAPIVTPPHAKPRPQAEPADQAPRARRAPTPPSVRTTVTVGASAYGRILFDRRGFALYAFTRDPHGRSLCTDECAAAWPPFLLKGELRAGRGADDALLGTTRRPGGGRQVTYDGRPLYYYVGDREPGQVLCQDVVEFGGTWLVLRGSGDLVR